MEIITEIISSEKVRPSSPTPHHLKNYKLSMLDQIMLPTLVPTLLYLPPNNSVTTTFETTQILKRSLSMILTRFYPLAGRLNEDVGSINCNDEGVPLVVSQVKGHKLSDHLQRNDTQLHSTRLFPCEVTIDGEMGPNDSVLKIQLNYFDCGGIVIAVVLCHAVGDAVTLANFLKSWAETTRLSGASVVCPNYIAQSLFPHKNELKNETNPFRGVYNKGKSIMRRYVFDSLAISRLKNDIISSSSSSSSLINPTRVEAVSALMWKCFMAANNNSKSISVQAVNLRRRAQPQLAHDCFGNLVGLAPAAATNKNETEMGLVRKMRDSIKKIDGDYVNRMQGDQGLKGYYENQGLTWGTTSDDDDEEANFSDVLSITSWCGFDFYGIDFGWAKPIWVGGCHTAYVNDDSESGFVNEVMLMDTKHGDGIEAWVALDAKYMTTFDNVEHLRTLAKADPMPGNI